MDDRSFDRLARLLGGASDRRTGLKAIVGGILGAGGIAALDDGADAKRWDRGDDSPRAGKKKKRKKCNPACDAGFACVKGRCTCAGVTCGGACCASGQVCRDGACAEPRPACLPFGAECKNVGRRCCDGLTCGSGQDGSYPATCLRAKGAACAGDAECPFGTACTDGKCLGDGGGSVPTGASCANGETCAQPGATCGAYTTPGAPGGEFCTLPLRKVCTGNPECACYNCWYVNDGASSSGRQGRDVAPVKQCIQPTGGACTSDADCASGLTCNLGTGKCGTGTQCVPDGGPCGSGPCCGTSTCNGGVCSGGGGLTCTVKRSDYADDAAAYAALKAALLAAQNDPGNPTKNPVYVGPGTWKFPGESGGTLELLSTSATIPVKILACDPNDRPVFDGMKAPTFASTTTIPTGNEWPAPLSGNGYGILWLAADDDTDDCGENDAADCAGFEIDGIDFQNANNVGQAPPGAIYSGVHLTLKNSNIKGCKGPGGGVEFLENFTLNNVTIEQCYGTRETGGLRVQQSGEIENVAIRYNGAAPGAAGGIQARLSSGDTLTLKGCVIANNASGGVANGNGTVVCQGSTSITNNQPVNCTKWDPAGSPTFTGCNCSATCTTQGRGCDSGTPCCSGAGTCQPVPPNNNYSLCCINALNGSICPA